MARLPYPPTPDDIVELFPGEDAVLNVTRMICHAEGVRKSFVETLGLPLVSTSLPDRLRELVILRVGHLQASPHEIAQHEPLAHANGLSDRELATLGAEADLADGGFSEVEHAALELVTEMLGTTGGTDRAFDRAHALLGDRATAELILLAAQYAGLALFLNALRVDIDPHARLSLSQPSGH